MDKARDELIAVVLEFIEQLDDDNWLNEYHDHKCRYCGADGVYDAEFNKHNYQHTDECLITRAEAALGNYARAEAEG